MLASVLLVLILGSAASPRSSVGAATEGTVVSATVLSATEVSAAGCPEETDGVTNFGSVLPDTPVVTGSDCVVLFGSSNDTARLRLYQRDQDGSAMGSLFPDAPPVTGTTGERLLGVDAVDANTAWAVGEEGLILHTTDGGSTWIPQTAPGPAGDLYAVSAVSGAVAYAAGEFNYVIKTVDGGVNWTEIPVPNTECNWNLCLDWIDLEALDATTVVMSGWLTDTPVRTVDGGATWVSTTTTDGIMHITAESASVLYGVGDFSFMTKSVDGGLTWNGLPATPNKPHRNEVHAPGGDVVWSVDGVYDDRSVVKTIDGGASFTTHAPNDSIELEDVGAVDGITAYVVGSSGTIRKTTDGGATWTPQVSNTGNRLQDIDLVDASTAFVVGNGGIILKTANGGSTWNVQRAAQAWDVNGITAADANLVVGVGADGHIRRTTDGGGDWGPVASPTGVTLLDVVAATSTRMIAVGESGTVITSTNGGAGWTTRTSGTAVTLRGVTAIDDYHAWAVGDGGTILASTDGGVTWTSQTSPVATRLRAVSAASTDTVWAVGDDGVIVYTGDGGSTWVSQDSGWGAGIELIGVDAVSETTAFATGDYAVLSKTDGGAATQWISHTPLAHSFHLGISAASASVAYVLTARWRPLTKGMTRDGFATNIEAMGPDETLESGMPYDVVAVDQMTAFYAGEAGSLWKVIPWTDAAALVADYAAGSTDWDEGDNMFGVCLRAKSASATADWAVAGACATADGATWQAIPGSAGIAQSTVAHTTVQGTVGASASFRFGFRAAADQATGTYTAPLTFEVVSPGT